MMLQCLKLERVAVFRKRSFLHLLFEITSACFRNNDLYSCVMCFLKNIGFWWSFNTDVISSFADSVCSSKHLDFLCAGFVHNTLVGTKENCETSWDFISTQHVKRYSGSMGTTWWVTRETSSPHFLRRGDMICHVPRVFFFRFCISRCFENKWRLSRFEWRGFPFNVICAEFVPSNLLFFYSAHGYFYRSTTGVPNAAGVALSFQALYRLLVITGLKSAILNSVDCWFLAADVQ